MQDKQTPQDDNTDRYKRILSVPPIEDLTPEYFLQHKQDIDVLLDHLAHYHIVLSHDTSVVLEIGAGAGMHSGFLSNHFGRVIATDIFKYTALKEGAFAQHLAKEHARLGHSLDLEKLDFIRSDAMNQILRDDCVDLGVSINTFEHVPDPDRALREIVRCVKSGGYIYIQFDPIWTADTGSHFFQYVPEPWGHLIYTTEQFVDNMKRNGAHEYEIGSFLFGINRKRLAYYLVLLEQGVQERLYEIVHRTSIEEWSGVTVPEHVEHPFMRAALSQGYSKEELLVRGMRWILRVI
jgi:SAM-dependent methyltransferase